MSTSYSVETTEIETSTSPNSVGITELETSTQTIGEVMIEEINKTSLPVADAKTERTVKSSRSDGDAIPGTECCSIYLFIFPIILLTFNQLTK